MQDLTPSTKGRFAVEIRAVTQTLRVIKGTRRYRTCSRKLAGPGPAL